MCVRRVPDLKLWANQARGAPDVAVGNATPGGTKGGKGSVLVTEEGIKLKGTNAHLPVIDKLFVADALVISGVGEELSTVRNALAPAPAHSG